MVGALALLAAECAPPTATPTPVPQPTAPPQPDMVLVPAGSFAMGDPDGLPDAQPDHQVTISRDLLVGRHCVTFDAFDAYCLDANKGRPDDAGWGRGRRPVIYVDWNMAVAYCNWLSALHGLAPCYSGGGKVTRCDWSASGYRLPTEAEWEYIARGGPHGTPTRWSGSGDPLLVAWHAENSQGSSQPVGQLEPNALGIYDLSGNVWEWCWDKYSEDYYTSSPGIDPVGPETGRETKYHGGWERCRRGGDWSEAASSCTVSYRSFDGQSYKATGSGMRIVRLALP